MYSFRQSLNGHAKTREPVGWLDKFGPLVGFLFLYLWTQLDEYEAPEPVHKKAVDLSSLSSAVGCFSLECLGNSLADKRYFVQPGIVHFTAVVEGERRLYGNVLSLTVLILVIVSYVLDKEGFPPESITAWHAGTPPDVTH